MATVQDLELVSKIGQLAVVVAVITLLMRSVLNLKIKFGVADLNKKFQPQFVFKYLKS